MKTSTKLLLFCCIAYNLTGYSQKKESQGYIEFNDRKNILHGVYLGFDVAYGKIDGKNNASIFGIKVAYVANQKMELGIAVRTLFSGLTEIDKTSGGDFDLRGIYGGLHVENVFFNNKKVKLSIPVLLGIGYIDGSGDFVKSTDMMGVLEPGINVLYNLNKYIQLEGGIKYRFSTPIDPVPTVLDNINGTSIGLGAKIGVFNLGKNRYKKQLHDHQN